MTRPPDLSEFEALQARRGPECSIGIALGDLDPAESEKLAAALAARIEHTAIARWMHTKRQAQAVSQDALAAAVSRHRNGQCACRRADAA